MQVGEALLDELVVVGEFFPEVDEVLLFEFPVIEPSFHLLHVLPDASGSKLQDLVHLLVLSGVVAEEPEDEVPHHLLLLGVRVCGVKEGFVEFLHLLLEEGCDLAEGFGLVVYSGGEFVGLQVDGVLVEVGLDFLVVGGDHVEDAFVLLFVYEFEYSS